MLLEKNIDWNTYEAKFKRGTYVKRFKKLIPFTKEELSKLPPKHQAHKNPDLEIERIMVDIIEYPEFNDITNKVDVIFNNTEPILKVKDIKK